MFQILILSFLLPALFVKILSAPAWFSPMRPSCPTPFLADSCFSCLSEGFVAAGFPAAGFPATVFPATDFPATDFPATDFPATDFPATDFLALGFDFS